ncbi:MAG: cytochrome C [Geobacteraceae bacterium]
MNYRFPYSAVLKVATLIGAVAFLLIFACGKDTSQQQINSVQAVLKQSPDGSPANALVGQIYRNPADNRNYIYNGALWIPHDSGADKALQKIVNMTQDEVLPPGACGTGTGAHFKHSVFTCQTCHFVGGVLSFDPAGKAVSSGMPAPTFDATTKVCSNIACHGAPPSTFSYYFPDGTGEPALNTVNVFGNPGGITPNWYSTGAGNCTACHPNPPAHGTDGSNYWHSGSHGGGNDCQLCHPDATGTGGKGTTITDPTLHANGAINVLAYFKSSCFNCH